MSNQNKQEIIMYEGRELLQVPEYPEYYADVELGEIYSGKTSNFKKLNCHKRNHKHDYVTVNIGRCMGVHEVVMAASRNTWEWKTVDGLEVDHRDRVKTNNEIDNLRLVTHKEQYTDDVREAMSKAKLGENHHKTRLNDDLVLLMRKIWDQNESREYRRDVMKKMMKITGYTYHGVYNIVKKNVWTHI